MNAGVALYPVAAVLAFGAVALHRRWTGSAVMLAVAGVLFLFCALASVE